MSEFHLRPMTPADLPAVGVIDGVRVLPWDDERFEEIRQVRNIAFIDHWGSTPLTPEFWAQHTRGHGARQDLSFIVVDDDDRVVAYCFNSRYPDDDEVLGRKDAWIDNLGTLPGWRGRGIASLLIAHSLAAFAADGLTHASIGVDSDSPTGAARLYRSLGFEPEQRSITYELEVV
jgi:ribosomal protein S18 acetylase RimI-like enzyme